MPIKLTYHGHSGLSIRTGIADLIVDPFLTGNAVANIKPREVRAGYILVSRAHDDHLGDAVKTVEFLRPRVVVLMHYNTFPAITQDAQAVADAIYAHTGISALLPEPGETLTL